MIAAQAPPLEVFVPIKPVPRADVPSQRLPPVAAIQAYHVLVMNGSPHRHGGNTNFLGLNRLSKLSQGAVHRSDEIRKLICPQLMMSHVARDDLGGQIWVILDGIHDVLCYQFYQEICMFEGSCL